ncbi:MAG: hypothetical protein HQ542_05130, partial [Bacteroidia bacterium]|nr:hypothetical protein [Bacteroidia bacterium]
ANGDYRDLEDFISRVPITIEHLVILIRVGAFRFTKKTKATLLWEAHMLLGKNQAPATRHEGRGKRDEGRGKREMRNNQPQYIEAPRNTKL